MTSASKAAIRRYAAYFAVWTALALFMFSQSVAQRFFSHDTTPLSHYLSSWLIGVYIWFLLTPFILWLGRRFSFEGKHKIRRIALHLVLSVAIALFQLSFESLILRWFGLFPAIMVNFAATLIFLLIIGFHNSVLTYWTILGIQYGFSWYGRYQERKQEALRLELRSSELQSQLMQARLSALNMQLQPHFLFNTLNTIMVLIRQQKSREAEEMLGRLGDLLRCVLEDVDAQEVPLRRELEYLELYLSIEQVRFQDRLRVAIDVDPEARDAMAPYMGLQPIVENAIRHGIGRSSTAGNIRIRACRVKGSLEIKVEDDGPGPGLENGARTRGIGLANTRARLKQLYGDAGRFTLEAGNPGGAVATMIVPYRVAPEIFEASLMETHAVHGVAG
ncbi:MAG: histidine kinase [Bryobacteraceae bacterium]|jgi:sensor histidine kinase YesM